MTHRSDEFIDHAAGPMRVSGAAHVAPTLTDADRETIHRIASERYAVELRWALQDAVNGASHWRIEARALLARIDEGELPEPPRPWR
jgi:hypothetical protein